MGIEGSDAGEFIYRMTITLRDGRRIRRKNGRPFRIRVRRK